jgi:hypothetical protein
MDQRLKALERSVLDLNRIDEIAQEAGNLLRADGVGIDTYGSVMNLNSFATTNGEVLSDYIPIPSHIIPMGGRLEIRLTGTIVNNSGATRTFWINASPSLNGTNTFSMTDVHSVGEASISVTSSASIRMWEYILRITRAGDLDPERMIFDETLVVDGTIANRSTLFDCGSNLDTLDEITHLLFSAGSNAANPILLIIVNTLGIQSLQEVNAPSQRWLSISADNKYDTFIRSTTPTNNFGTANILVGESNAAVGQVNRGLIHFPALDYLVATYPNAVVLDARLSLTMITDLSDNARTMRVYPILVSWSELGATWNTRDGSTAWSAPGLGSGTDRGATQLGQYVFDAAEAINQKKIVTLSATEMQKYFTGEYANYGFLLQMDTETNDAYSFSPADSAYEDSPVLYIRFSLPAEV